MCATVGVHVAFHHDEGVYKHWGLFMDGPTNSDQIVLQIMGSSTNYRFDPITSDPRESDTLEELIHLCDVPVSKMDAIKDAARNAPIHNEYPGYNCQDYVLDLLDDLEDKGIIDKRDKKYQQKKEIVKSKQEGLI